MEDVSGRVAFKVLFESFLKDCLPSVPYSHFPAWHSLLVDCGWIGSLAFALTWVVDSLVGRPLVVARVRLNTQQPRADGSFKYNGVLHTIYLSWKEEGHRAYTAALVPWMLSLTACQLVAIAQNRTKRSISTQVSKFFESKPIPHVVALKHAAVFTLDYLVSVVASHLVCRPLETIIRRMDMQGTGLCEELQIPRYRNWMECARRMLAEEGLSAFYKGVTADLIRDCLPAMILIFASDLAFYYAGAFPLLT